MNILVSLWVITVCLTCLFLAVMIFRPIKHKDERRYVHIHFSDRGKYYEASALTDDGVIVFRVRVLCNYNPVVGVRLTEELSKEWIGKNAHNYRIDRYGVESTCIGELAHASKVYRDRKARGII